MINPLWGVSVVAATSLFEILHGVICFSAREVLFIRCCDHVITTALSGTTYTAFSAVVFSAPFVHTNNQFFGSIRVRLLRLA